MRKDDRSPKVLFRSKDRIYAMNGAWYFQTREDDHGPFPSRQAAEHELKRYVSEMSDLGDVLRARAGKSRFGKLTLADEEPARPKR